MGLIRYADLDHQRRLLIQASLEIPQYWEYFCMLYFQIESSMFEMAQRMYLEETRQEFFYS